MRTALLIRCNSEEADKVRFEAQRAGRTISTYVLSAMRAAAEDERLFSRLTDPSQVIRRSPVTGPRTAILIRCDAADAERIREAARRRDIPINAFVIQALKSTWKQQMSPRGSIVEASLTAASQ